MDREAAPAYVDVPGEIVGTPPYLARGCIMQGLLLDGDRHAQQAMVDRLLVQPAGGELVLEVLTSKVLLAAVYVDAMGSTAPNDQRKGVIREWDIGFWTCVWGGLRSQPLQRRLYWVPSFLFVDTATAMAAGREVFGYPKSLAGFSRAQLDPHDPGVALDVLHYPRFGPDERPVQEVLVRIERAEGTHESAAAALSAKVWAASGLPEQVLAAAEPVPRALTLEMPQLMLRQVRDAQAPDRACVQAAAVVAIQASAFQGAGLIPGRWNVTLTPSASHPIAQTLGLAPTTTAGFAYWVRQDFTVAGAQYLWQAG